MLCAKYDYKMDIAVKQKEAFADGMNVGMEKAKLDAAKNLIKMNVLSPEQIAQGTGLPIETVLFAGDCAVGQYQGFHGTVLQKRKLGVGI